MDRTYTVCIVCSQLHYNQAINIDEDRQTQSHVHI